MNDKSPTLNCNHEQPMIAGQGTDLQQVTGPLMANSHPGSYCGQDAYQDMLVPRSYMVRRLTPLECERLQGFPDGWTDISVYEKETAITRGKAAGTIVRKIIPTSDSVRYKALGNSIALPPWRFVLSSISEHLPQGATLGSLFDGIGGFPLIWQEIHGDGTARWASEIEPFPIAVTKARFGEG